MRISDWSSDVCSSDLDGARDPPVAAEGGVGPHRASRVDAACRVRAACDGGSSEAQRRPGGGDHRHQHGLPGEEGGQRPRRFRPRSEEHTSELQSLMRISYAVFCLKKKKTKEKETH